MFAVEEKPFLAAPPTKLSHNPCDRIGVTLPLETLFGGYLCRTDYCGLL